MCVFPPFANVKQMETLAFQLYVQREKGRHLTKSFHKGLNTIRKYKSRDNKKMHRKALVTQRLRTDLGR